MTHVLKVPAAKCPEAAALNVSEAIIEGDKEAKLYKKANARLTALGNIKLSREMLSLLCAEMDCNGPVRNDVGQLVCPLARTVERTNQLVSGPSNTTIDYEKIAEPETKLSTGTGLYL